MLAGGHRKKKIGRTGEVKKIVCARSHTERREGRGGGKSDGGGREKQRQREKTILYYTRIKI